ncbi:MAG: Hint domain-containing protein [Pseudomonadota bacterium]
MGTGFRGTFVISWSQTEIDGLGAAPTSALSVGAAWSWHGDPVRVDGPSNVLRLDGADGSDVLRHRAARRVRALVGAAIAGKRDAASVTETEAEAALPDRAFVVTDGARSFTVTLIETGQGGAPLLMFHDDIPPQRTDLWVVHHSISPVQAGSTGPESGGVICFTPGTQIDTGQGTRSIEELLPGDMVQTKDNGLQRITWTGRRRMTGARLFALPQLRPVRISAGALGTGRPDASLLVSPEHRMLVQGDVARALFNTEEVLVAAKDLINGTNVSVDLKVREVTYVHVLLERHEVIWANGVETESFHPANAALSTLAPEDRARLLDMHPELEADPHRYGPYARRNLLGSEAALLRHAA